ncbi:MAG: hypothetical protein FWC26_03205 [Fibromonadales bacterium]|nr:hypothetical protein [Fibromonadales bacterium]
MNYVSLQITPAVKQPYPGCWSARTEVLEFNCAYGDSKDKALTALKDRLIERIERVRKVGVDILEIQLDIAAERGDAKWEYRTDGVKEDFIQFLTC